MGLQQGEGFVLRARDFAESDLIVTLFTEQWGKRTAIAKGARRFNSRLGGVFDLLNRVEVVFYQRARLDLVSQGALLHGFPQLKGDLDAVSAALAVGRLLDHLLPLHQPEGRAYALFSRFLDLLEAGDRPADRLRLSAVLKLLTLLGHRPQFNACVRCGATAGPFLFVGGRGGVLCSTCAGGKGIKISRGLARSLDWLLRLPLERAGVVRLSGEERDLASEILNVYIDRLVASP